MKIRQILLVFAAFGLTSALLAQTGQGQTGSTPGVSQSSQNPTAQDPGNPGARCNIVRDDYMSPVNQTQVQILCQAAMRRQLEDQAKALVPLTEREVTSEAKTASAETLVKDVKARGVDFDMTPGIEKRLRKANVSEEAIEAARQAGPKLREQMAKMILGPNPVRIQDIPIQQMRSFSAIIVETDPDKVISSVNGFAKEYPASSLLSYVYSIGANAYQHKGDVEMVVEYTGKSLKLNPDNLTALALRAGMLPQPQFLRSHPADRGRILSEALSDARHALLLISQLPKQPNEAEAEYEKRLAGFASEIHGPLGVVHLELASGGPAATGPDKAELAKAEQEFTMAVANSSHPDPRDYYRLGEAYAMDGKYDDAIQTFTKAGTLGQGTLIKNYANEQIAEVKKRKAQGTVASNPSASGL